MTYCVGLQLDRGLVFLSDTRTNAGVDNISTYRKLFTWEEPGERVLCLMTAGNLATTQAVVSLLNERNLAATEREPSLLTVPSMFQAAKMVGDTLKGVIAESHQELVDGTPKTFGATLILGGQIGTSAPRLFMIYPEGNFVEAQEDTPFFQIGETKYGRPILVRAYDPTMDFATAVKLLMVSFDSTIRANLSVGTPLDLQIIEKDALRLGFSRRIQESDPDWRMISDLWSDALRQAFHSLPDVTL
ncbi:peptidase [Jannaschia seohaensis]|uniref:Putative proteasome-type protease n=1 Tax=Jannaschia seohaensis TaxID=475081 RepID=A0A2Y9A8U0_9RHOB|nr:peptidase [Jannaschia seohaensis]PWJ22339.1 putative proteasome-type protease [Jannaschia seohaensis]SSA38617.1 putative proteasome-type protease [Jannaschia seohaensis]